ncbi:MAG: glycosyltransferase [Candidatus Dojkabacteria bacterium]|nr:glycosyltransferase [Candidatus Dojkabacteria bacterium]
MRILLIVHDYLPTFTSGTEVYTHDLAQSLSKLGHEVKIFTVEAYSKFHEDKYVERYFEDSVEVIKVHRKDMNHRVKLNDTLVNNILDKEFKDFVAEFKPELTHIQHLITMSLTFIDILKESRSKVIYTIHDLWFMCPTIRNYINGAPCLCTNEKASGTCSGLVLNESFKLENYKDPVSKFIARLKWMIQRKKRNQTFKQYLLKVDKMIVPSEFLYRRLISFLGEENKGRVVKIQHGMNIDKDFEKRKVSSDDKIKILYPSNLSISKGVADVERAFEKLEKEYDNYELILAGPHEEDSETVRFMDKLQNLNNVKYIGKYKPEERFDLFAKSDLVLIPSQWDDIYNLVLDEALVTKKFVIVTNKGAMPERVVEGENGFIYEVDSTGNNLYEAIKKILDNPLILNREAPKKWLSQKEHINEVIKVYNAE